MAAIQPQPRLDDVDPQERRQVLRYSRTRVKASLELIRSEPGRLEQTRYSILSSAYLNIGLESYALGLPLDQVRNALAYAALADIRVVVLRGTEEGFPVLTVTLDPSDPGRSSKDSDPWSRAGTIRWGTRTTTSWG